MGGVLAGSLLRMLLISTAFVAAVVLVGLELEASGTRSCVYPAVASPGSPNTTDLDAAFRELIARDWLSTSDRAVCVGPGSSHAAAAMRRMGFHAAVKASPTPCCGLPFEEGSFDFAFSASLDLVRVPARVLLEMERVIRPGRFGAVFCGRSGAVSSLPSGLMRAAAPVAALLRSSDVIGARAVSGGCAVVVFQKRAPSSASSTPVSMSQSSASSIGLAKTKVSLVFYEMTRLLEDALEIWVGPVRQMAELIMVPAPEGTILPLL